MLRQRHDTGIRENGSCVCHEEQKNDDVKENDVDGAPKRFVQPGVHDKPSVGKISRAMVKRASILMY